MNTGVARPIPSLFAENMDLFACPVCEGPLSVSGDGMTVECSGCQRSFPSENGIPLLFWPNEWDSKTDVTGIVKAFYEENPFPNYEGLDSGQSLRQKAAQGVFAHLLDDQIPHGAKLLEVGCGTGQLSNFLGMRWGRTVFGADLCVNSLNLGQDFKQTNDIDNAAFVQMNLFRPVFQPASFDLVVCNGVLHHTSDPFLGFQSISKLVKKGGYIIVGLYNTFGRIPTDIRRLVFKLPWLRLKLLDYRFRDRSIDEVRRQTWFMDQYKHPHESKHSFGEVLRWFDQTGFQFVNSIPNAGVFESFAADEKLFGDKSQGSGLDHFLVQAGMLLGGGSEGGFFIMIGRKAG